MAKGIDKELGRILFETASDAIVVLDNEALRIFDVNPSACRLFGYDRDELLELTLLDLTAEPDATRKAVAEEAARIPKRMMRRKDGSVFPAEISATRFRYDGREIRVGFVRDITDRIEADEALRHSEAKFSAAFHTSPDSVNLNRMSDGLFLDINHGFTVLTGYTAEDVEGKTSLEVNIWACPEDRARLIAGLRESGQVENLEADFRVKDGSLRTGLMSARIIQLNGDPCILSVTRDISRRKQMEQELLRTNERLAHMSRDVILVMGRIVELRDPYTQGHQLAVSRIARDIAETLGLDAHNVESVETAGLLHDVGKLRIPAEILMKPGELTDIEMGLVRFHSEYGYDILKDVDFPSPVAELVLVHHERMDGSGYPRGLAGDDIPLLGRILAVADVVEAMASHRPYRPALGLERAIEELGENGHLYDPDVVRACIDLYARGKIEI